MQNKVTEIVASVNASKYPIEPICEYDSRDMYFLQIDKSFYRIVTIKNRFYAIGLFNYFCQEAPDSITEKNVIEHFLLFGKIFRIENYTGGIDGADQSNIETEESIKNLYNMFLQS